MTDSKSDNSAATVATRVAQFVAATNYCDLPPELLDRAKLAMLDTVGAAIAGARTEGCSIIREYIVGLGCDAGGATIFGTKMRTLPRFAALANGSAINTDDFDDTYHP